MAHEPAVTIQANDVEIRVGHFDEHYGVKLGVADEPYWRIHLTPQGTVLRGDGHSPPTPVDPLDAQPPLAQWTGAPLPTSNVGPPPAAIAVTNTRVNELTARVVALEALLAAAGVTII